MSAHIYHLLEFLFPTKLDLLLHDTTGLVHLRTVLAVRDFPKRGAENSVGLHEEGQELHGQRDIIRNGFFFSFFSLIHVVEGYISVMGVPSWYRTVPIKGGGKHLKGHTSQAHTCHRGTKRIIGGQGGQASPLSLNLHL